MKLAIGSLASGSGGNSYLIKSESTSLLVDAGISAKQITERLKGYGCGLPDAILVTHEHSDHIQGLPVLLKKGISLYVNEGTKSAMSFLPETCDVRVFNTGDSFEIGDISVSSFPLSHDAAEPSGFSFSREGACVSIITDTGYVTPSCFRYMQSADVLVLESNHDESILRVGRYPWFLKQRILSDKGHLSNEAAAKALAEVLLRDELCGKEKKRLVLLAHLSKENNFPQMALATMSNVLENKGFVVGKSVMIDTLSRTESSPLYML